MAMELAGEAVAVGVVMLTEVAARCPAVAAEASAVVEAEEAALPPTRLDASCTKEPKKKFFYRTRIVGSPWYYTIIQQLLLRLYNNPCIDMLECLSVSTKFDDERFVSI